MFYYLACAIKFNLSFLNMLHYVSFRSLAALLTSFTLFLLCGNQFIQFCSRYFTTKARDFTPESHQVKNNTPNMGGLLIIAVTCLTIFLWSDLLNMQVIIMLMSMILFGAIGFWDDWCKKVHRKGISIKVKWSLQLLCAFAIAWLMVYSGVVSSTVSLPFLKNYDLHIGFLYVAWAVFIMVATSNAVNLTDGLDGLAISSFIPNVVTFSIICYLAGHYQLAHYLFIPFTATSELVIVGCALIGSSLGFLWYNAYPAQIFMGDVGSLSLGAVLASMALICKQELLLVLSAGVFVLETVSVILQVIWVRCFGRKLFRLAPIHHHFELIGIKESKITVRFTIVSIMLCLLALITLKIR